MKKTFNIVTTFIIFLSLSSYSLFSDEASENFEIFENDLYYIEFPSDWILDQSGNMGTTFILYSPLTSSTDKFQENINIITQDLSEYNMTFKEYLASSEEQISKLLTDSELISSEKITHNGRETQKVIFTGKQYGFKLKFQQLYFMEDETAYVLTLTCESSEYDNYQEIGGNILKSFKLQ